MPSRADDSSLTALAEAGAAGDRAALQRLYAATVAPVRGQVGRMLGWGPEVDDVLQEVYLEVFRSLGRFRGESSFGTWLYRLAHNVIVSCLRRRGPIPVDLGAIQTLSRVVHEPNLDARRQVRALYAALDQVPLDAREAFVLYELEGRSLKEIADLTGEALNTVASRVRRTRERLRRVLDRTPGAKQVAQ